jgi:hypothetical protein
MYATFIDELPVKGEERDVEEDLDGSNEAEDV